MHSIVLLELFQSTGTAHVAAPGVVRNMTVACACPAPVKKSAAKKSIGTKIETRRIT
jgi:hypothetical protein